MHWDDELAKSRINRLFCHLFRYFNLKRKIKIHKLDDCRLRPSCPLRVLQRKPFRNTFFSLATKNEKKNALKRASKPNICRITHKSEFWKGSRVIKIALRAAVIQILLNTKQRQCSVTIQCGGTLIPGKFGHIYGYYSIRDGFHELSGWHMGPERRIRKWDWDVNGFQMCQLGQRHLRVMYANDSFVRAPSTECSLCIVHASYASVRPSHNYVLIIRTHWEADWCTDFFVSFFLPAKKLKCMHARALLGTYSQRDRRRVFRRRVHPVPVKIIKSIEAINHFDFMRTHTGPGRIALP